MKCLNDAQVISYMNKLMPKIEQQAVQQHLESCSRCQKMLKDYEEMQKALKGAFSHRFPPNNIGCFEDEELVSYLEGDMERKAQKGFHTHLAHCRSCTDRLIALDHFLQGLKAEGILSAERNKVDRARDFVGNMIQRKFKSIWDSIASLQPAYRWVGIVLILIAVGFSLMIQNKSADDGLITREPNTNQSQIQLIGPKNESLLRSGAPEFKWKRQEYFASYSLLILDSGGNIIWEKNTNQGKLTLPSEIQLQPSMIYFWQVEAFFKNGGSVVSEMASFIYNP